MNYIKNIYNIYYKDKPIGVLYIFKNKKISYSASRFPPDEYKSELNKFELTHDAEDKTHKAIQYLMGIIKDENRIPGTRKKIYQSGDIRIERKSNDVDKFIVYRCGASKGTRGYSEKKPVCPHHEGGKEIEGMNEWVSWYCFNKKDDGMYEAELDEAWCWGGGHNDGGTIHTEVPEEWLSLPYDEFLERVVTLSAAAHYGFTAEDLKNIEGLKAFFGFE